ncbi:MAG: hypothetical protein J6D34_03775 [Atopobiaceae bacterium]|nr:hypothetical protein [Atopobiaceae bacterium]
MGTGYNAAEGPMEAASQSMASIRAAIGNGDDALALRLLERSAADACGPSPDGGSQALDAYDHLLDELLDGITRPEDLACYHRAKGLLALAQGDDRLAAAHLSVSLRFGASDAARSTLLQIRERNGSRFDIGSYNEALELLLASHRSIGPVQGITQLLEKQLDQECAAGNDAAATWTAQELYNLTLDKRYLM